MSTTVIHKLPRCIDGGGNGNNSDETATAADSMLVPRQVLDQTSFDNNNNNFGRHQQKPPSPSPILTMDTSQHVRFELRFHKRETEFPTFVCNRRHRHHKHIPPEAKNQLAVSSRIFYPKDQCIANGNCPVYISNETLYMKQSDKRVYTAVTYTFFYQRNLAIGCGYCCFPHCKCLGYHDTDVERVTVLYHHMPKMNIYTPTHVYFHAHGKGQGQWKLYRDCELVSRPDLVEIEPETTTTDEFHVRNPNNKVQHIVVYVARGSHAAYPEYGMYPRIFGLANDVCQHFHVAQVDQYIPFDPKDPDWVEIDRDLSTVSLIPEQSMTPLWRFFLPIWTLFVSPKRKIL